MITKEEIRNQIRLLKKKQTAISTDEQSGRIAGLLEQHPLFTQARRILLYHALPDEAQTECLIEKWHPHKKIYLPVVCGENLKVCRFQPGQLIKGNYGIWEPTPGEENTESLDFDLIIVPGMAFDRKGHRLGRGKGYYDRLLAGSNTPTIGLCLDFQLLDTIPTAPHDISMDCVITPNAVYEREK